MGRGRKSRKKSRTRLFGPDQIPNPPQTDFTIVTSNIASEYIERLRTYPPGSLENTAHNAVKYVYKYLIPAGPTNARHFGLREKEGLNLKGIYRAKAVRLRVTWIASSRKKKVIVLYIGKRKEGDKKDVYQELGRLLLSGKFDKYFEDLGITQELVERGKRRRSSLGRR